MYQVTIEPVGEVLDVEEDQTILDAILRAGLYVPYQCGHGLCSTCKITVLDGEVEHGEASPFALLDFEREEGVTLACCATPLSDLVIEADMEEDPDAQSIAIEDFEGIVEKVWNLSPRIKGVRLKLDRAVEFQAGQYINISIPGVDGPRAFSIASKPSEKNIIELHVCFVEGGRATGYIHNQLQVGDALKFTAPLGRFFVRKSKNKPCVFIAGGSGLSSPKSMVEDLLENNFKEELFLFHGARNLAELYYADHFKQLAKNHPNFTYVGVLSEPEADDNWQGETGFVHEAVERLFEGKCSGRSAYLCGPPPMIEAGIRTLMKGRLFEEDIYTEKFISQADGEAALSRSKVFKRI
jgi:phenol hydroxylase P5 protein